MPAEDADVDIDHEERAVGGEAEPMAIGLVANPCVPSGSGMGTVTPLPLPPLPPLLLNERAPGQKGGHCSATPKESVTRPLAEDVLTVSVT